MLVIRHEQIRTFQDHLTKDWLLGTLRERFPQRSAALSGEEFSKLVAASLTRARARGLESLEAIRGYVCCCFLLGADVETAPSCAWAKSILDDPDIELPIDRIEKLEVALLSGGVEPGGNV